VTGARAPKREGAPSADYKNFSAARLAVLMRHGPQRPLLRPQSTSASRRTAELSGFLDSSQSGERSRICSASPCASKRYRSSPSLQTCLERGGSRRSVKSNKTCY
jgi:hypothetical protein